MNKETPRECCHSALSSITSGCIQMRCAAADKAPQIHQPSVPLSLPLISLLPAAVCFNLIELNYIYSVYAAVSLSFSLSLCHHLFCLPFVHFVSLSLCCGILSSSVVKHVALSAPIAVHTINYVIHVGDAASGSSRVRFKLQLKGALPREPTSDTAPQLSIELQLQL